MKSTKAQQSIKKHRADWGCEELSNSIGHLLRYDKYTTSNALRFLYETLAVRL